MRTMTAQLDTVTALERRIAMLLAVFAVVSLGIAALGQYAIATFAYAVAPGTSASAWRWVPRRSAFNGASFAKR